MMRFVGTRTPSLRAERSDPGDVGRRAFHGSPRRHRRSQRRASYDALGLLAMTNPRQRIMRYLRLRLLRIVGGRGRFANARGHGAADRRA